MCTDVISSIGLVSVAGLGRRRAFTHLVLIAPHTEFVILGFHAIILLPWPGILASVLTEQH